MSSQTVVANTGNQANISTDTSKIFLGNILDKTYEHTNGSGGELTYLAGTLIGRAHATGKVTPLIAAATDGSQVPFGILMHDLTVANGATANMTVAVSGEVAQDKVLFNAAETLATTSLNGTGNVMRLDQRIAMIGIYLVASTELTGLDNA